MRSQRIFNRRKELKLTQVEVAKFIGITKAAVSKWEKGDASPKGENLYSLAKILKCDVYWLLTGQGSPKLVKEKSVTTFASPIRFPLIEWHQVQRLNRVSPNQLDSIDCYSCPVKCSSQTFILKVTGKSMNPIFTEGEFIFVDPKEEATSGKYVIAYLHDEKQATLKQFIIEDGRQYLQATNPSWPSTTSIIPVDDNCKIMGVVLSTFKLF